VLIIIPARSGSKGIPNKNIYSINGFPLIKYTIDFAKAITMADNILVSTDSLLISSIAKALGASCPFLRPEYLSGDRISDMEVLSHALTHYENYLEKKFDIVIMLQPTSPVRSAAQLIEGLNKLQLMNYESLISVSPVPKKFHGLKQFEVADDKLLPLSRRSFSIIARQQLSKSYIRNGVFYIFKSKFIKNSKYVFSKNTGYVITEETNFNIDTLNDIVEFKNYLDNL
jgi:CMP-N,N'-diacetyllegionaminic acid synthase